MSRRVSFEHLYTEHHRAILAYCARRMPISDAWDAAADVFVVAWRRLDEVPRDAERPWLYGVAHRVLANKRRSGARRLRLAQRMNSVVSDNTPSPEEVHLRGEEVTRTLEALSRLRPIDREILLLSFWEELIPEEIALSLGISRAAVDQRFSRAKRRMERELRRSSTDLGDATPKPTRREVRGGSEYREANS